MQLVVLTMCLLLHGGGMVLASTVLHYDAKNNPAERMATWKKVVLAVCAGVALLVCAAVVVAGLVRDNQFTHILKPDG